MPTVRGKKKKTEPKNEETPQVDYSKFSQYKKSNKIAVETSKGKSKLLPGLIGLIMIVSLFSMIGVFSPNSLDLNEDEESDVLKLNENDFTFEFTNLQATLVSSETCGCCHEYVSYLESNNIDVDFIKTADYTLIKLENNIPYELQSCHTMIIEGYFVEGHVPLVVVNKLLEERPQIDGISLPGMPAGSPGMPGDKNETFKIQSIVDGSSTGIFAKV